MRRVAVVGVSGAGKTRLARMLAAALEVPHVELDSIYHQPGWQGLDDDEFRRRVSERLSGDGWVADGNYSTVRPIVLARADTAVWLDLPRWLVARRVISRTLRRTITREELWNGNREPLSGPFRLDPEKNIILWSITKHGRYREQYGSRMADPELSHIHWIRLTSDREVDELLRSVGGSGL